MPEKRKRRVASPSRGLAAGEKIDKTRLRQDADIRWSWVGTRVKQEEDITENLCLRAAGLDHSSVKLCPNKYVPETSTPQTSPSRSSRASSQINETSDVIVISDEESQACCDKKSCKENPFCLNYMGQDKWENEERAEEDYMAINLKGEDPHELSRKLNVPVGLRNLGATCYANAFLQVWFQDLAFRSAVYRCQPTGSWSGGKFEDSPVFKLQVTFAALQESNQQVYNPIKLVESLQLQTAEQQDAQEFSKLFMSHLDNEFKKQSDPQLQSLLPAQFEGKVIHTTVCDKCKSRSERKSSFLELEVNLVNNAKLDERIAALLQPERMIGDNQYQCSVCDSLQDATRYTELRDLPPVLHVSLLRFVYDTATWERKKSKDKIHFPPCLNMNQFHRSSGPDGRMEVDLTQDEIDNHTYELRGVLLHKGASAYHGHYEAQVYDRTAKKWYQFNDEVVSHLDSFTTSSTRGTVDDGDAIDVHDADADDESSKNKTSKRPKRVVKARKVMDSDDEPEERVDANNIRSRKFIHSKDAYMLIYAKRGHSVSLNQPNHDKTSPGKDQVVPRPPERAMELVTADNNNFLKTCSDYDSKKEEAKRKFRERRLMVMDVYKSWAVSNYRRPYMIASRTALEKWVREGLETPAKPKDAKDKVATISVSKSPDDKSKRTTKGSSSDEEFPDFLTLIGKSSPSKSNYSTNGINNNDLLCRHNRLCPLRTRDMKAVSMRGYELLQRGGCSFEPEFSKNSVCADCVRAEFRERLYQIEHPRLAADFNQICNTDSENSGFFVSRAWVKDWVLQKPKMHKYAEDDPGPDSPRYASHVECEHGGRSICRSDYRRITDAAVDILKGLFPNWKPVPWSKPECEVCKTHLDMSKEAKLEMRKKAENEKALLSRIQTEVIYGRKAFSGDRPCAIIPSDFIRAWRAWLSKPGDTPRPHSVDNSFLFCAHEKLLVDFNSSLDFDESLAVITREEWNILSEFYDAGPLVSIRTAISCDSGGDMLHFEPDCCVDCRMTSKLDFVTAQLFVVLLQPEDAVPSSDEARGIDWPKAGSRPCLVADGKLSGFLKNGKSGSLAPGEKATATATVLPSYGRANGTRQSRRIRDNWNSARRRSIEVRKSSTLREVKKVIESALNIAPYLQRVFYHGRELRDDGETVATLRFLYGDTLYVKEIVRVAAGDVQEVLDSDADADGPSAKKKAKKRNEGSAFEGTLLGGGRSSSSSSHAKDETGSAIITTEAQKQKQQQQQQKQKQEQQEQASDPAGSAGATKMSASAKPISCCACTFNNPPTNTVCEICDTPLPQVL